jgi:hypothetical protein
VVSPRLDTVNAVVDEEPCDIGVAVEGRRMERCPPILVMGCHVGAMLDEDLCDIEMNQMIDDHSWMPNGAVSTRPGSGLPRWRRA